MPFSLVVLVASRVCLDPLLNVRVVAVACSDVAFVLEVVAAVAPAGEADLLEDLVEAVAVVGVAPRMVALAADKKPPRFGFAPVATGRNSDLAAPEDCVAGIAPAVVGASANLTTAEEFDDGVAPADALALAAAAAGVGLAVVLDEDGDEITTLG